MHYVQATVRFEFQLPVREALILELLTVWEAGGMPILRPCCLVESHFLYKKIFHESHLFYRGVISSTNIFPSESATCFTISSVSTTASQMANEDLAMSDVTYPDLGIEAMKAMLEKKLQEINCAIERGMDNIKIEVISQVKTLHISMEGPNTRQTSAQGGFISRMLTSNDSKDFSDTEVENLKRANQLLKDGYQTLETERDQLKQSQVHQSNKIRELHLKLSTTEQETRAQLGSMELKNRQLQEQTQAFRDIIINKGSSDHDAVDDSTIINEFVSLREQIQRIVLKYYKRAEPHHLEPLSSKILEKKQKRFLSMWKKDYTGPQLRSRTRAMIFELLADEILQTPMFGLDDFGEDRKGVLEQELVDLEMALMSTLEKGTPLRSFLSPRIISSDNQGLTESAQEGEQATSRPGEFKPSNSAPNCHSRPLLPDQLKSRTKSSTSWNQSSLSVRRRYTMSYLSCCSNSASPHISWRLRYGNVKIHICVNWRVLERG